MKYLFQDEVDLSWNYGNSSKSPCSAGRYRLDPSAEGSEIFDIRDGQNQDKAVEFQKTAADFCDATGTAYPNFAAFYAACKGFFFRRIGISQVDADGRYVQIDNGEPIELYSKTEIDAFNNTNLQGQLQNDIIAMSGIDYKFPVGSTGFNANTATLVDGTMYFVTYNIKKQRLITGVAFNVATAQAAFTADNFNGFALYSVNKATGDMTEIVRTANDGNIWKGALNTKLTADFVTPQTVQPGIYAVGFLYNSSAQTTAVVIGGSGTAYSSFHLFNNNIRLSGLKAAQADLPASVNMSTFSIQSTIHGILLR